MENVLVSACLLGTECRYDGMSMKAEQIEELAKRCNLVPVCPEIYGGLPTPRIPAERTGEKVLNKDGEDVTAQYEKGARAAAEFARVSSCRYALLKERSPSCGKGEIYDGTFRGVLKQGDGVTAERLSEQGLVIYGESQIEELIEVLKNVEKDKG